MERSPIPTIYLVTGILSNLRSTLAEAITTGEKAGFGVKVLDLVHLVPGWKPYPNPWQELGVHSERIVTPRSAMEFRELCEHSFLPVDVFVFLHLPQGELVQIWKAIKRNGSRVGAMTVSLVPMENDLNRGPSLRVIEIVRSALRKVKSLTKPVPDLWIVSGSRAKAQFQQFFRSTAPTRFIQTHSPDFEVCRKTGKNQKQRDSFILFLDQGWHSKIRPDFFKAGSYPPTQYETYRKSIVRSLLELQRVSGEKVVVSAHPKADLAHTRSLYEGLEISSQSSATLSGQASLIVGNSTTSIQYAAIHSKPLVLFTSNELNNSIMYAPMAGFQKALDAEVINIDDDVEWSAVLERAVVNKCRYREFVLDYVGDVDSVDLSMWQKIFAGLGDIADTRPRHG